MCKGPQQPSSQCGGGALLSRRRKGALAPLICVVAEHPRLRRVATVVCHCPVAGSRVSRQSAAVRGGGPSASCRLPMTSRTAAPEIFRCIAEPARRRRPSAELALAEALLSFEQRGESTVGAAEGIARATRSWLVERTALRGRIGAILALVADDPADARRRGRCSARRCAISARRLNVTICTSCPARQRSSITIARSALQLSEHTPGSTCRFRRSRADRAAGAARLVARGIR